MRQRVAVAVAAALGVAATLAGCGSDAERVPPRCSDGGDRPHVTVHNAPELTAALAAATPGQQIEVSDGAYVGQFVGAAQGTKDAPIRLCGGSGARLDGGSKGYALHLDHAAWWTVEGLTIAGGQKSVVLDATQFSSLVNLKVSGSQQEAVHLRRGSSDNIVAELHVSSTGRSDAKFGEGIYIGSAKSNWCELTNCQPDASDRNLILDSTLGPGITAELIDIKEGTRGGTVRGNSFDGTGQTAVDYWLDVKGNNWSISRNRGTHAPTDGFQVHRILDGWGTGNTFTSNQLQVDAAGYGIKIAMSDPATSGNTVACNNTATGAGRGLSNVPCTG